MKAEGKLAKGRPLPRHQSYRYTAEPVGDGTLGAWNISKRQSHDWQQLAKVPEPEFEAELGCAAPA
jgi:hypothetical protein